MNENFDSIYVLKKKSITHSGKRLKKKNTDKLLSIITAVYNGEKYLQETIDSIVPQKFKNYEYIVIDGKSTDNTLKIIKKNLRHINFWLSEKDQEIYYAFNKGMDLSTIIFAYSALAFSKFPVLLKKT